MKKPTPFPSLEELSNCKDKWMLNTKSSISYVEKLKLLHKLNVVHVQRLYEQEWLESELKDVISSARTQT